MGVLSKLWAKEEVGRSDNSLLTLLVQRWSEKLEI